ncbi:Protein CBR-ALY-1 [Caenorhabditis briggsae]|uniref:Protein CBR-ALY-1 n=1 Tax=Caenorhabditis briggsae TaxID=6238 RepID=A8Y0I4_CAEBR|nr:Protein CBR-ALY-1 [Caenorhabditis briggsae]CAP38402.1 Protein CBR-ALY-1 [Caenorhabditis briggsae]
MARAIDIDAPLSSGIRRSKNFKKSPIKRASTGGIKKRFSGAKPSGSVRRQSGGRVPRRQSGSFHKELIPSNDNREVRVNLSNLAPSVLSGDLRQLFAEFKIKNCSVNFNEKGAAAGTGDITLSKRQADRLIQKFAGVALDGKEMKFAIIDTTNIANRVKFPSKPQRVPQSAGRPRTAQRTPKKQGKPAAGAQKTGAKKTKKPKREEKPKKTVEEMDAEIDAYMARAN